MKYLINRDFGGFEVPKEMCEVLNCEMYDDWYTIRTDRRLIDWVEAHPLETSLRIVELDASWTDWELRDYDGVESIIAVKDGRLIHI